ncbi:tRNA glutamyl-Q(34) synthetase GluQRS [Algibacillus agarilyticus]|uniref:tRNA glutamyl-Q(34) synthetase GluQRS n=1 Tax=Algibacillus agarilyticus TaxID=2234133 RepID=UPI000DD0E2E6|nr:tRNA glutamyl-Q(34) synthetase GluQRS [Algibacillus agarilyticus]
MYIGRFAPSPSGPLHFGSIVTALASYLDAKSNNGKWLVRIEDIDPPREQTGASKLILSTLEQLGLYWDDSILYQSKRLDVYQEQLNDWLLQGQIYGCNCNRKRLKELTGIYDRHCINQQLQQTGNALRFKNTHPIEEFTDLILGTIKAQDNKYKEDFLIHRRDGLYAYQLAVVIDDIYQNITHVVRGQDLLPTTYWQQALYQRLNQTSPQYTHIPLVLDERGLKLSKQNHAPAVNTTDNKQILMQALQFLNQACPVEYADYSIEQLLHQAKMNWQQQNLIKNN